METINNSKNRAPSELLPIYKPTLTLAGYILDLVKDSPKFLKHAYGDRMISNTVDMVELIVRANMKQGLDRVNALEEFVIRLSSLKALIIIYKEKNTFPRNLEANISLLMSDIGKQCTSWKNSTKLKSED